MEPALAFFAPLLGKCFAASLSPTAIDRHCFSAVYAGVHVRDTHVVTVGGKAVYSGETIYSATGDGVEFTYLNSTGGVGHGTVTVQSSSATFAGSMKGHPGAKPKPINSQWTLGQGGYDVVNDGSRPIHVSISP